MPSRTLHVSIARPHAEVYDFVMDAERMAEWAAGLGQSVRREGDGWVVQTPDGELGLSFVDRNTLGVADHAVTLPSGLVVLNPIRVLPNGDGAEVIFTLFHRPEMSAAEFEADAAAVQRDLETLKRILEKRSL